METGPYIYLILEREFKRLREAVVKGGHTGNLKYRMNAYPKGSLLLAATPVTDALRAEKALHAAMTSAFRRRTDIGREYFEVAMPFKQAMVFAVTVFNSVALQHLRTEDVGDGPVYVPSDGGREQSDTELDEDRTDVDGAYGADTDDTMLLATADMYECAMKFR